jgi:phage gp45-like
MDIATKNYIRSHPELQKMNVRDPEVMEKLKWLFGPLKMNGNNMQLQNVQVEEEDEEMQQDSLEREREKVLLVLLT